MLQKDSNRALHAAMLSIGNPTSILNMRLLSSTLGYPSQAHDLGGTPQHVLGNRAPAFGGKPSSCFWGVHRPVHPDLSSSGTRVGCCPHSLRVFKANITVLRSCIYTVMTIQLFMGGVSNTPGVQKDVEGTYHGLHRIGHDANGPRIPRSRA